MRHFLEFFKTFKMIGNICEPVKTKCGQRVFEAHFDNKGDLGKAKDYLLNSGLNFRNNRINGVHSILVVLPS